MVACLSPNGLNVYQGSAEPTSLFVATVEGVALLQRDARGWRCRGLRLEGKHISALLFEPERGGLFAGVHGGGLYRSLDLGETWERRDAGLPEDHVFSLGCARSAESILYAGTEPPSLAESRDYGETWAELSALREVPGRERWFFPGPPHVAHTKSIAFDPRDANHMYVAVEQGALLETTDGGRSWTELSGYARPDDPFYHDVHLVVPVPTNPDELFLTTGVGLYHSTDGGRAWERLTASDFRIGYPDHFIVSPLDSDMVFMAGASKDPTTWRTSGTAEGIVMRSRDSGRSWHPPKSGWSPSLRANVEAMSIAAFGAGFTLFAGTTDGVVYVSTDAAERWSIAASVPPISKVGHYKLLRMG